jgi:hypothetical protein
VQWVRVGGGRGGGGGIKCVCGIFFKLSGKIFLSTIPLSLIVHECNPLSPFFVRECL